MKPVSPWAEVQPEETLPTLAPPASASSVWAEPQGVDLHAGLKPIAAPAPQPSPAMGKLPAAMEPQTDPIAMQPQTDPVAMPAQKAEAPQTIKSRLNSKLERDYEKDANPWGSPDNHPGFFGKLAHALNHATGGDTRRQWEENGLVHQINTQQAAEDQSAEKTAQTARTTQQTASQPDKDAMDAAYKKAQTENLESETAVRNEPDLARAYAHAVNQAVLKGQDPAQDPIVQHLSDAITSIQKETKSKGLQYQTAVGPDGKPHVYGLDEQGNKVADIGQHYEKPMTVNVNAERAEKNGVLKAYQPTLDSAERMNVMTENYEKAIKDHDQQAMLSLLANHLGMTMGLQKGARLTKDIIHEAQQSQPWLQGVAAKFDKDGYLSGVTLSPNQMRQMVGLGQSRYAEDAKKSRSTAQYLGAKDDGPERHPGTATKNYYLGAAGGDRSKAMQLMVNDGWTVPNGR